ncbi:ATP-dependent DNA ligase [Streptomyces sp. NPDC001606]
MSFEALRRRAVSGGRTAARLAQDTPAHFIAFDLLQLDGQELLHVPYGERRAQLEQLFTEHGLSAPWTLCPQTTDPATAQEWLTSWTQVPGVEGLVIRGSGQRYLPGVRALYKMCRRDTTEAVIGAITGTVRRPQTVVLGALTRPGHCGRSAADATAACRGARHGRAAASDRARTCVGRRTVHDLMGVPHSAGRRPRRAAAGGGDRGGHRSRPWGLEASRHGSYASAKTWRPRTSPRSDRGLRQPPGDRCRSAGGTLAASAARQARRTSWALGPQRQVSPWQRAQ